LPAECEGRGVGLSGWRVEQEEHWTTFVEGLDRQVHVVRGILEAAARPAIPVHGVLCFTRAELPLLRTLKIRDHPLLYRKVLAKQLNADGPMTQATIDCLATALARALRAA
jgi:hypothetical protein